MPSYPSTGAYLTLGKCASLDEMIIRLQERGIRDAALLDCFRRVPRIEFVPPTQADFAYNDSPLPIGFEQTISQPYIVALTTVALELKGHEKVLEIGTGSGYAAAILSLLARDVFTVERIVALADQARDRLARLGYDNVHVLCADGTLGWPEHQPYDAIAVTAGSHYVPPALLAQLAPGGRLVMPIGPFGDQVLTRIVRADESNFRSEALCPVSFVPLIGKEGVPEEDQSPSTDSVE